MSLPAPAMNYLESLYEQALEEGYDEEQAAAIAQAKFEGEDYVPTTDCTILPVDRVMEISSSNQTKQIGDK